MDPSERIVRRGELSESSLVAAVAAERGTGRSIEQLAVGSRPLELQALRILSPHGGLDDLRASVPNVVIDGALPADGWELREAEHAA